MSEASVLDLHTAPRGVFSPAADLPSLRSFWMGGFESACQINTRGVRIDMVAVTQHDVQCADDYALLADLGIHTVRDGVRWHLIEKPDGYDFSSLLPMLRAAHATRTQVIWNICHYGWPDNLDIFAPGFVDRFARFCAAVANCIGEFSDEAPLYCPINEISFLAWAIGYKGIIYPYRVGEAGELKRQLIRAVIAGCDAIREVDPRARFIHIDPMIHVVCPRGKPELQAAARCQHEAQFDAWDMICGKKCPELGGDPKYLDVVGVNYYHSNQFEHPDVRLRWEDTPRDDRFVPFHQLLARVHKRYQKPMLIAETSHFGDGRAAWITEMGDEISTALRAGTPLLGACIYPIIDRPDWEDPQHWHHSGLFDLQPDAHGRLHRVLHNQYAQALRKAQHIVASALEGRVTA